MRGQAGACAAVLDAHSVCAPPPARALQVYHEIAEDSTEAGVVYIVAQGTPACSHPVVPAPRPPGTPPSRQRQAWPPYGSRQPRTPARRPSAPQGSAAAAWPHAGPRWSLLGEHRPRGEPRAAFVCAGVPVDVVVLAGQAPPGSLASQDHQLPVAEAQEVVVLGQPAGAPPNDEMAR